jgi:cell division initiation protein
MHQSRLDLSSPVFRRATRGFDPEEVRAFLDVFAPDYDNAYAELERLRASLASVGREVEALRDAHRSLVRVLAAAEEGAQVHAAGARRDAERILADAEAAATALVAAHEQQRCELEADIEDIEQRRRHARETLEGLIEQLKTGSRRNLLHEPPASAAVIAAEPGVPGPAMVEEPLGLLRSDARPPLATDREPATAIEGEAARSDASWPDTWSLPTLEEAAPAAVALPEHDQSLPARDPEPSQESAPSSGLVADAPQPSRRDVRWVAAAAALASVACIGVLAWPRVDAPESSVSPQAAHTQSQTAVPAAVQGSEQSVPVDPLTVKLWAARPCWIRLLVDDKAETRVLAQGEELVRGAARYVELRVGDAAALTVEVNGSRLPPLGRAGQVVDHRFEVGAVIE